MKMLNKKSNAFVAAYTQGGIMPLLLSPGGRLSPLACHKAASLYACNEELGAQSDDTQGAYLIVV
ncbi:hypothetical protein GC177_09825 [bacterium]|nr:hypothetical protein [bacterium]